MLKLKFQYLPPDGNNWLIRKAPDAGKDWRKEETRMTEDVIVGWHHRLNGHEFEQALRVGDGQGSLACCSPWGCKEPDMTELTATSLHTLHLEIPFRHQEVCAAGFLILRENIRHSWFLHQILWCIYQRNNVINEISTINTFGSNSSSSRKRNLKEAHFFHLVLWQPLYHNMKIISWKKIKGFSYS